MRLSLICLFLVGCSVGFMEDILRQMGGGGGGGGNFQFNMGGGGMQQGHEFPGWPRGLSGRIHSNFDWVKGTVWNWNNWRHVTFEHDGNFKAPTPECEQGACKWMAGKKKVYVMWGREAGLHILEPNVAKAEAGTVLKGTRKKDKQKAQADFVQIDEEAAALNKDLHKVMGISPDADELEIKKAYRKLSVKYHPDKNKNDPAAVKLFNEVREANEILSDPDKRFLYETAGLKAVREAEKEDAAASAQQHHQDPFAAFFGGGGGQQVKQERRKAKKGASAQMDVSVPLETMYNGGNFQASMSRRVVCRNCRKSSAGKCAQCNKCPGQTRMVQKQMGNMIIQQQEHVESKEKCKQEEGILDLEIERGIASGHKLTFARMNEQTPGEIPGDVVVTVKQTSHSVYKRTGKNLFRDYKISLKEALLGFESSFTHMDDREVHFKRTGVTQANTKHVLKGEGMPVHDFPSDLGDMTITLKVQLPKKLSEEQKAELEKIL